MSTKYFVPCLPLEEIRWESADTKPPAHRSAATFAAARIRAGHTKYRNFLLSPVAAPVHARTAVLVSVVEGLRPQPSSSRQGRPSSLTWQSGRSWSFTRRTLHSSAGQQEESWGSFPEHTAASG
ncbi:hypothetical protein ACLKA6_008676 [Drosophila palustris]